MRVPFEVRRIYQGHAEPKTIDADNIKSYAPARSPLETVVWLYSGGYMIVEGTYGAFDDKVKEVLRGNAK